MKIESLRELYLEQLQDLYNAELQLIKALPKMAKAASSAELVSAFEEHLEKTRGHAQRIESICEQMGEKASGKKCKAMEGLVKEGGEVIEEDMTESLKDAALIGYGCVRAYATKLGDDAAAELLGQTLDEEKEADETLNGIAEQLDLETDNQSQPSGKKTYRIAPKRSAA
jgi:ferritin-like metal-binding protein YciE